MRAGFPTLVVRLLVAAFALSLVGLLSWFAYFTLRAPGVVVEQVGPVRGLWLTAALSACVASTSGLLAFHYKHEGYTRGEEVVFRSCLMISAGFLLFSGIWAAAVTVFG